MPALSPFGSTGGEEDLERGVRKDDGAHVAPVGHQPGELAEGQLQLQQGDSTASLTESGIFGEEFLLSRPLLPEGALGERLLDVLGILVALSGQALRALVRRARWTRVERPHLG